jgi:hypothetical protein
LENVAPEAAAWVEAIDTICAVFGACWVAAGESRAARLRKERVRLEVRRKEERSE